MRTMLPLLLALACLVSRLPVSEAAASMTARRLQQQETKPPTCYFEEPFGFCIPSQDIMRGFIEETPDSELKDLMLEGNACFYVEGEDTCNATEHCRWSEGLRACRYKAARTDFEHFRKCIGEASYFMGTHEFFQRCQNGTTTEEACDIKRGCGWDNDKNACEFDAWKALTGVASESISRPLPKGIKPLLRLRAQQITEQLSAEGITESGDILAFKPSPMKCPEGIDVVLCILAEAADRAAITEAYCQSKSQDNACASDPKCDESCMPAENVIKLAERTMANVYNTMVTDTTAALILRRQNECLLRPEAECPKDKDCRWDADSTVCIIQWGYVLRTIAQYPLNSENPDCAYIKPIFTSGCTGLDREPCGGEKGCYWDEQDDFCIASPGRFLLGYLDSINADDDLQQRVSTVVQSCGSFTDKEGCQ